MNNIPHHVCAPDEACVRNVQWYELYGTNKKELCENSIDYYGTCDECG